jgi:hypothetical protein
MRLCGMRNEDGCPRKPSKLPTSTDLMYTSGSEVWPSHARPMLYSMNGAAGTRGALIDDKNTTIVSALTLLGQLVWRCGQLRWPTAPRGAKLGAAYHSTNIILAASELRSDDVALNDSYGTALSAGDSNSEDRPNVPYSHTTADGRRPWPCRTSGRGHRGCELRSQFTSTSPPD